MKHPDTGQLKAASYNRAKSLQNAVAILEAQKQENMRKARGGDKQPNSNGCFAVIVLIIALVIAFPATGMLLLFA